MLDTYVNNSEYHQTCKLRTYEPTPHACMHIYIQYTTDRDAVFLGGTQLVLRGTFFGGIAIRRYFFRRFPVLSVFAGTDFGGFRYITNLAVLFSTVMRYGGTFFGGSRFSFSLAVPTLAAPGIISQIWWEIAKIPGPSPRAVL